MNWIKSKTVWFGIAIVALGQIHSFLPSIEQFISPDLYGQLTSAIGIIIIILRSITTTPISNK